MTIEFPRTTVGGASLSRMIIGTNWFLGWSHTGAAADCLIRRRNATPEAMAEILEVYLRAGVDTLMGPLVGQQNLATAIDLAEAATGRRIIKVDTPIINPTSRIRPSIRLFLGKNTRII